MELPNVKDLERLLKMCRKQGITDLTMGDMSFKFGDLPTEQSGDSGELEAKPTDEEMIYWSAQPDPLEGRQ